MTSKKKIIIFLALTVVFSLAFWLAAARAGSVSDEEGMNSLWLMWAPGLAALVTSLISDRSLQTLGFKQKIPWKYVLLAFLIPAGYGLVVYGIAWLTGLGAFTDEQLIFEKIGGGIWAPILSLIVIGIFPALGSALGEEIGWRGLLVPELSKMTSFAGASLISGIIWALWRYPVILFTEYKVGAPLWLGLICFTVMTVGISFLYAWLRLRSRSVWPPAMLHASHNVFIISIFNSLTKDTGSTGYFISEYGLGLAAAMVILAGGVWYIQKRSGEPLKFED